MSEEEERREAIELFQRDKKEQEQLEKEVPNILQQVDAKILLQFLKGNPNATQLNIINVGRVEGGGGQENTRLLIEQLMGEINSLKAQLEHARDFNLYEYMCNLPQPRGFNLVKNTMSMLMEKFGTQKDSADFFGVTRRVWCYMMSKYEIPGYVKKQTGGRKKK